jgi:glyoxylase-like metal-dependent hydrolase (beta-lactamase superfamily II)/8-oxo-dGTP pyrophosphatase MutT (NUDIX family)
MGGAVVFPGGSVASPDRDERWEVASMLPGAAAARVLDEPDERLALGFYVCALREAVEEVGLPLTGRGGPRLPHDAIAPGLFLQACLEQRIELPTDRLIYAGRWVTPVDSPVRFDTRFFLAAAPEGFHPRPSPEEVETCYWAQPAAVLGELAEGSVIMAPPTIDFLQRLEGFSSTDEILQAVVAGSLRASASVLSARLSPRVSVVIAPNAGIMTGPGTNTYIVGRESTFVIDPAVEDRAYIDAVAHAAGDVAGILVTHRHADHVAGVRALAERTEAPVRAYGAEKAAGVEVEGIDDGDVLAVDGATLRVLHTPGHAPDHISFVLEEERALFAGDNVMGEGTPVIDPPEGHMRTYIRTLRRLAELDLERIYPGHFRPLDRPAEVWSELLEHRRERERRIVGALDRPSELADVVCRAYRDTAPELHSLAIRSALAHLEMLEEDDRVLRDGRIWRLRTGSASEGQARQEK